MIARLVIATAIREVGRTASNWFYQKKIVNKKCKHCGKNPEGGKK